MRMVTTPPDYERLESVVPVLYAPGMAYRAHALRVLLESGARALSEILGVETPRLQALQLAGGDWPKAPREGEEPYPPGLPYFTRATDPPTLVMPEELSPLIQPRTGARLPLTVWHELAHAFFLSREVVRAPAWLGEFVPQALSAAVAHREWMSLWEHLRGIDREPGFTVRSFRGHAAARTQMEFQNLLLLLGASALEVFGEGFSKKLVHALWEEKEPVNEARAEELLADALGPGGREWLLSRPEF